MATAYLLGHPTGPAKVIVRVEEVERPKMSQLERQREEVEGKRRSKSSKPSKSKGKLVNWTPNKEQRDQLKKDIFGPLEALERIESILDAGCRMTVGANDDESAYYCIIREKADDWRSANGVSVWATTAARAITAMGYYMTEVNPDFPHGLQFTIFDEDW